MSIKYKDLFQSHIKHVEYLLSRTQILNQYLKDINNTGNEIEIEVREFIGHFIPNRFKITHGFICYAKDSQTEPVISPQLDCIIVDTLVSHTIFPLSNSSGQEVVPLEAVVGIIEIKRTLNDATIKDALTHLANTVKILGIEKTNQLHYLPSGISSALLETHIYSNPLIGILSVDHTFEIAKFRKNNGKKLNSLVKKSNESNVDFMGSLSGFLFTTIDKDSNFKPYPFREINKTYSYMIATQEIISQTSIISRIIGFIVAYLSMTSGKFNPMGKYFFHRSTWEAIK